MPRPVTLFTGQWADLTFDTICAKAKSFGYDGVEIACWGDHFEVDKALSDDAYIRSRRDILAKHGLQVFAISNHLVGQAVCDRIDERHKSILPDRLWGDGKEDGVRERAAEEMKNTARAAAKLGVKVVPGFTGSPIWHMVYSFPPNPPDFLERGLALFAQLWAPILDVFSQEGVKFALEVHPTEIAFDIASADAALTAVHHHPAFGFNYDPSHFGYQGVDYVAFIRKFADRIFHAHMKDVYWSPRPTEAGVFGGHLNFGDARRFWDFRSLGRGSIDFEEVIRALNDIGYTGPLSVEWEDGRMDREHGATEACAFVKKLDFAPSAVAFDAAFAKE
ncbi:MAG: sugar phosphate isomerase/epimerase [Chloroflexi bacterium]|nr:sugar phosphate isomerase/epimerase [Ardenticatenaceae bacterium]MBL1128067.1 sugar phosphate isomerase/epimerase [Chloroflexota bacterium]NOG34138.1 sugar phosphate isomerase/epimerase [Chloroflexota bacterium]GIK56863.1 MAG: AP endonuclease [Chloroflexota bacterium]